MKLAIDTNIIFSALISSNGVTAKLLLNEKIELFAPKALLQEIIEHKEEIISKAKVSTEKFQALLIIYFSNITFVEDEELFDFTEEALRICPDKDDVQFFALSLAKGIPLWSNDKELKKQNIMKVINTEELSRMID